MSYSFPIPAPYTPHETELAAFFGEDIQTCFDEYQQSVEEPVVLVCFINRSGSNYLMEILANDPQFHVGEEVFETRFITDTCKENGIKTYDDYLMKLFSHANAAGKTLCAKVSWDQLFLLTKIGFVGKVLKNVKFIFLYRENVIDQAISFHVAQTTGTWKTSAIDGTPSVPFEDEDCVQVMGHAQWFLVAKAQFELYFQVFGLDAHKWSYEELVGLKPKKALQDMRAFIFGEDRYKGPDKVKISLKVQRNARSVEIRSFLDRKHRLMFDYGSFL